MPLHKVVERKHDQVSGHKITDVLFTPKTGRTHQLCIHSQLIGHPIIGCDLYNSVVDGVDAQTVASRLCLHASRLSFIHPVTGEMMGIECEGEK